MNEEMHLVHIGPESEHGSMISYIVGFILSIALTLSSYFLVIQNVFSKWMLIAFISGLGVMQMIVQLLLFLQLGDEAKPRWNLLAFLFMVLVVFLLVFGSLWIMYNLDDRVMPNASPMQLND